MGPQLRPRLGSPSHLLRLRQPDLPVQTPPPGQPALPLWFPASQRVNPTGSALPRDPSSRVPPRVSGLLLVEPAQLLTTEPRSWPVPRRRWRNLHLLRGEQPRQGGTTLGQPGPVQLGCLPSSALPILAPRPRLCPPLPPPRPRSTQRGVSVVELPRAWVQGTRTRATQASPLSRSLGEIVLIHQGPTAGRWRVRRRPRLLCRVAAFWVFVPTVKPLQARGMRPP